MSWNQPVEFHSDPATYQPFGRDPETLARPYAVPGTPGLQHRIGGLEKADGSGDVSYSAENHQRMTDLRSERIARIANDIPELQVEGDADGDVLVLGWGSTYGAILTAAAAARAEGVAVSTAHLRYLNPFPRNLGDVLSRFQQGPDSGKQSWATRAVGTGQVSRRCAGRQQGVGPAVHIVRNHRGDRRGQHRSDELRRLLGATPMAAATVAQVAEKGLRFGDQDRALVSGMRRLLDPGAERAKDA